MIKKLILIFIIWRVFLFIPLFEGYKLLPYRQDADYTNIWKFTKPYAPVDHFLMYPWANFDGVHYLSIAASGYQDNERFLPAFPMLIRLFVIIFGSGEPYSAIYFFTALGIVHVLFFASLILLYKLIRMDFSEKIALRSIVFLLIFPVSFFFVSIYSESLFLFLSLLCFYFARRKQWFFAGIAGMILSATRVVGISILPALLYELFISRHSGASRVSNRLEILDAPRQAGLTRMTSLLLIPLGLIGYALFNFFIRGDALYFLKAHESLGNSRELGIVLFPQTIFRYIKILITLPYSQFEWWIALLELVTFVFAAVMLYVGWKHSSPGRSLFSHLPGGRLAPRSLGEVGMDSWKVVPRSYLIFSLFCFFIPTSSGTFTALPRYVVVLFPVFITLALVKNKAVQIAYGVIAIPLLFFLLMFFSRGYFVA